MKKVGILTFHHSYNCGSMMQAVALQNVVKQLGIKSEIIDFSNEGQRQLYRTWFPGNTVRNIVKNSILLFHQGRLNECNSSYEEFMKKHMILSQKKFSTMRELSAGDYSTIIAGSDQIWNITIDDSDDAYFLPWAKDVKKIAYAPSFGAKNILKYAEDSSRYAGYLRKFAYLSIRENNGKKWIHDLIGVDVPVVLDPTLLLTSSFYDTLIEPVNNIPEKFIFYYAPHYDTKINDLVTEISKKTNLPVVGFNSKAFYVKGLDKRGFILPDKENPATYLFLIKNASLVITTSFHGTVFSSIFRKCFWTVKTGGMLGDDDRVATLTNMLNLNDRLISIAYNDTFDYMVEKDYSVYEKRLSEYKKESMKYLSNALEIYNS